MKPLRKLFRKLKKSRDPGPLGLKPRPSRDLSEQFPHVPQPEREPSILRIAAAWQCRDLYGEDMPGVAADLLEAGFDSPALRRLAGELQAKCMADVEDLVRQVFRESCIPYPLTDEQAQLIFARQVAREVIAGEHNPWDAAYRLERAHFGKVPNNPDLAALFALSDEWKWDGEREQFVPAETDEIVQIFARLGSRTNAEIFQAILEVRREPTLDPAQLTADG